MWSASVLTTISSDTEPTIVVTFDSAKYIFNAGENTNRAFLQSRGNWRKARGIFFTEVGTKRCNGLPGAHVFDRKGLLMSLADATISHLSIVGPPGLLHYMSAMRSYTYRDSVTVDPVESSWSSPSPVRPDPLFEDANISVYGIPVVPSLEPHSIPSIKVLSETGIKRKRSSSADLPEKRPALMKSRNSLTSWESLMQAGGDHANEWRRLMINLMFPATRVKTERKSRHRGQSKEKASLESQPMPSGKLPVERSPGRQSPTSQDQIVEDVISEADPQKKSRPNGFNTQLPMFVPHTSFTSSTVPTLGYLIVGPRYRGKFDVHAANALGIPRGPLRGELAKGNSITFNTEVDGNMVQRTVRPEACIGKSEPPGAILIFDIPTISHIPALISSFDNSPFYTKLRSDRAEDLEQHELKLIFHLCGPGVLEDSRYIAFMNSFLPDVQHVISSREHCPDPVTFTSIAFNQLRLNQLDRDFFPLPKFSIKPKKELETIPGLPPRWCSLAANQEYHLRTSCEPTFRGAQDFFHAPATSSDPPTLPLSLSNKFASAKENIKDVLASGYPYTPKGADVKVIPLGTCSAMPSKYRNVSSTLIQNPNWGNILLDVGEGTWGQLVRQFGLEDDRPNNVWDALRDLKCIYVSHIHGDHHIGLASILANRRLLTPPPTSPLYLVTVRAVHLYIRELSDLQDLGLNDPSGNGVVPIMSESLHWKAPGTYQTQGMWKLGGSEPWTDLQTSLKNANNMCRDLGLERFSTVDVFHRVRCYGAVIKHTAGWSIVYSGDTQPTNTLVAAGKDATLLIHEATLADDQEELAKQKAHSTFGQALDVGKRMNAEHILLTHFSARYPKAPPSIMNPKMAGDSRNKDPVVALAFDHVNMSIGDMWKLKYYLPAVEQSFLETATEEGDSAEDDGNEAPGMEVGIE